MIYERTHNGSNHGLCCCSDKIMSYIGKDKTKLGQLFSGIVLIAWMVALLTKTYLREDITSCSSMKEFNLTSQLELVNMIPLKIIHDFNFSGHI